MKIIEEKVWWTFTCFCCKSVCEADPTDAVLFAKLDYEGDKYYGYAVECGKCGKEHEIPSAKLTDKIKLIANSKKK